MLVVGPTEVTPPAGAEVVRVRSAAEMHRAVLDRVDQVDAVVMAAAVADYTPATPAAIDKLQKAPGPMTLELTRTPDILAELGEKRGAEGRPVLVGFAAETTDVVSRARQKLRAKQVDIVVANDVSRSDAGFGVETNAATIVSTDEETTEVPLGPKRALARVILDRIEQRLSIAAPTS